MKKIRKSAVAGYFYPADPQGLSEDVTRFVSQSEQLSNSAPKFLVVPHAGYDYSGWVAGAAFREIESFHYKRVVLLGPSHHFWFDGVAATYDQIWECPTGDFPVTRPSTWSLIQSHYHQPEHSLEVQLPFLHHYLPEATLIPLLCSGPLAQAESLATAVLPLWDDSTLWVISSDMNHVGPRFNFFPSQQGYKDGVALDQAALEAIIGGQPQRFQRLVEQTGATICGALPLLIAMHLMRLMGCSPFHLKSYNHSAAVSPSDNSVGYAALYGS